MDNTGGSAPPPPPPPPPEGGGTGGFAPKGIGDILSSAFDLYIKNAAQLLMIAAIVVVPLTLVQAFLTTQVIDDAVETGIRIDPATGEVLVNSSGGGLGRAILASILLGLISAAIWMLLTGALTRGAAGSILGRPIDVGDSYRAALARLGGLIVLALLVAVIIGVGFALLVIPGIIFLVFLSMAVPAFIVERKSVSESLSRSWNLVSGSWWHVLGAIVVAAIISGIVSGILGAIGGDSLIGSWIFSAIAGTITAPFFALVSVILYVDLRARREGLDRATLQRELDATTS